jgi:hypothetical protein
MAEDLLNLDIKQDLERIDAAMTRIVLDDELSMAFRQDPNGTMVRMGMHPPTTSEVNDRTNRVFYATVTNQRLNQYVIEHYRNFVPVDMQRYAAVHDEGLRRGVIQNDLEFDLLAAEHLLGQPGPLREVFRLLITDLSEKRILQKQYSADEIEAYLDRLIPAIVNRQPIKDHPVLEEWDRNYGVGGFHFGAEAVEVGPVATVYTAVEVGLLVTVAGVMSRMPSSEYLLSASVGDRSSALRLATMTKIVQFAADVSLHAQQFEQR